MIIRPEQELKNKQQILDMAKLLFETKKEFLERYVDDSHIADWAFDAAVQRLSVNTGHSFE